MADLHSGPTSRFDLGNAAVVDLLSGTLASVTDLALFGGANAFAVESAPGVWEVLQAAQAELLAPGRYRLTRLLRGQRGTEWAMGDPTPAGARVVVLDAALAALPIGEAELGLPATWRIGPALRPPSDESYVAASFTPAGVGLRPFSVVHVEQPWRTAREPGDLVIRWTRRSRSLAADGWDGVPLAEESEAYEVEILDGPERRQDAREHGAARDLHGRAADRGLRRAARAGRHARSPHLPALRARRARHARLRHASILRNPMSTSTHLLLPYVLAAQAQKHVTVNEALRLLDGLVQLAVLDRHLTAPPASPADGDRYIVASGATGAWAGWDLNVAYWVDGAWMRLVPRPGLAGLGGRRGELPRLGRQRLGRRGPAGLLLRRACSSSPMTPTRPGGRCSTWRRSPRARPAPSRCPTSRPSSPASPARRPSTATRPSPAS